MTSKTLLISSILFLSLLQGFAQEKFRIMFYNVENMYDTKDNATTNDDDLTPQGKLHWTDYRYWKKQHNIATVISAVGEGNPPALIGLCEVENDSVLYDLTQRTKLRKDKYRYIVTASKDLRGSNVALLYQRDQFKVLTTRSYTPYYDKDSLKATRDILHVAGKVVNGDTLDIFVCHFPSRREGVKRTRPLRTRCAEVLREKADSIFKLRKQPNILIMGDFNDYPDDISLNEVLAAKPVDSLPSPSCLYNLFYHKNKDKNKGSYKYRGRWGYVDQFIVSGTLLDEKAATRVKGRDANVFHAGFLLEDDNPKYGGVKPLRTYSGWKYLGGYSDHLPIYMDLYITFVPNE